MGVQVSFYGRSVFFPSTLLVSLAFTDLRCLNSYPLDQVGSGKLGGGEIYDWLKKGILLMSISCIHTRKPCAEPLAQRHILFIVSFAAVRLTSGRIYPSPATCIFLNEIVNRERSESCYITEIGIPSLRRSFNWTFVIADITNPLLGLDFLNKSGLIVDCSNKTIYDPTTTQRKSLKISASAVNLVVNETELPSFVLNMIKEKYTNLIKPHKNSNKKILRRLPQN